MANIPIKKPIPRVHTRNFAIFTLISISNGGLGEIRTHESITTPSA